MEQILFADKCGKQIERSFKTTLAELWILSFLQNNGFSINGLEIDFFLFPCKDGQRETLKNICQTYSRVLKLFSWENENAVIGATMQGLLELSKSGFVKRERISALEVIGFLKGTFR